MALSAWISAVHANEHVVHVLRFGSGFIWHIASPSCAYAPCVACARACARECACDGWVWVYARMCASERAGVRACARTSTMLSRRTAHVGSTVGGAVGTKT